MANSDAVKQLVSQYVEAFNQGDVEALYGLFTTDAIIHGVFGWCQLEVAMTIWREMHYSFEVQLTLEDLIVEGEQAAARYTERAKFATDYRGLSPTGREFEQLAFEWFTIRDSKIAALWGYRDAEALTR